MILYTVLFYIVYMQKGNIHLNIGATVLSCNGFMRETTLICLTKEAFWAESDSPEWDAWLWRKTLLNVQNFPSSVG